MLAGPAMAIPPGTYIERELKSKEEHEAGVAAAPPQPAHTAPSPPRRERENRERASERASDRPLLLRRPLSCFNCGIEHVQRQLANTTYLPLRPASAFQRVPVPFRLAELPTTESPSARERPRATRRSHEFAIRVL